MPGGTGGNMARPSFAGEVAAGAVSAFAGVVPAVAAFSLSAGVGASGSTVV